MELESKPKILYLSIFDIVEKTYKGKFSQKFVAGSHDPQGLKRVGFNPLGWVKS